MNKIKTWTVVGICGCGCEDSFVEYVEAPDADRAARKVLRTRGEAGTIAAVIRGEHASHLSTPAVGSHSLTSR